MNPEDAQSATQRTDDDQPSAPVLSSKDYCTVCDDPLGSTGPVCYTCGGSPDVAGGSRIAPREWQLMLGVPFHLTATVDD